MREPPKALGPIGSAGGGGLVWAAQQFHWEWPTWAVDLVACVSTIFLIWTLISGVQWLWHVLNDWRANHGYSRLYVDSSYIIVALLSGAAALLIAAAIVFFAHSATATTEKIAATPKPLIRPETRLRLRLDPSGTRNYLQESEVQRRQLATNHCRDECTGERYNNIHSSCRHIFYGIHRTS